jgi:hypothetical protein
MTFLKKFSQIAYKNEEFLIVRSAAGSAASIGWSAHVCSQSLLRHLQTNEI